MNAISGNSTRSLHSFNRMRRLTAKSLTDISLMFLLDLVGQISHGRFPHERNGRLNVSWTSVTQKKCNKASFFFERSLTNQKQNQPIDRNGKCTIERGTSTGISATMRQQVTCHRKALEQNCIRAPLVASYDYTIVRMDRVIASLSPASRSIDQLLWCIDLMAMRCIMLVHFFSITVDRVYLALLCANLRGPGADAHAQH